MIDMDLARSLIIDYGYGRGRLAKHFNVSGRQAAKAIKQIEEEIGTAPFKTYGEAIKPSRPTVMDRLREEIESDQNVYTISKKFLKSPPAVSKLILKAKDEFDPAGDWVRKAAKSGVRLGYLKQVLQIKDKKEAEEILLKEFPGCFVIESALDDGDTLLTPISDSKNFLNRLDVDINKRQFKLSMVSHNYLVVKVDDNFPEDQLTIFDLTDIHVGAVGFRRELFKEIVEYIRSLPGALVLLGGDLVEAITKVSIADPQDQMEGINAQVVDFLELIMPISHKIVAQEWGNHCGGRLEKAGQFDLARNIATMLKVPYFRERAIIDFHFKGQMKRISLTHKYGKALRKAQIELAIEKIMSWSNYKISCFFSGHTHESVAYAKNVEELIPGKGLVTSRYFICNGGSFISRNDTYASREDFPPTPQDVVYYWFDKDGDEGVGTIPIDSN